MKLSHLLRALIVGFSFGLDVFEHLSTLLGLNVSESLKFGSDLGQNLTRFGLGFLGDGLNFFDGFKDLRVNIFLQIGFLMIFFDIFYWIGLTRSDIEMLVKNK